MNFRSSLAKQQHRTWTKTKNWSLIYKTLWMTTACTDIECQFSLQRQSLYRHLLLCSTDEWSGRRRNSVAGEINPHKTQLNLGLNPAPEALWPRVQVNRCALGSMYISLLKIHDCWSLFLCLMSKGNEGVQARARAHTHTHTYENVQWKDLTD